jgi:HSP20 family protein
MNNIIKKADSRPKTFGSVVDELFQTNLNRYFDDRNWGFSAQQGDGRVPVNIRDTDAAYEVEVIAPGLKREDFHLSYTGDMLTIAFEHKEERSEGDDKKWIRREFRSGSFTRSFQVDGTVDVDKAQAKYENGVLLLTLPKKEEAKRISRTIDVK